MMAGANQALAMEAMKLVIRSTPPRSVMMPTYTVMPPIIMRLFQGMSLMIRLGSPHPMASRVMPAIMGATIMSMSKTRLQTM